MTKTVCHVLSFLCVDLPVITPFSLSDIDSSAPDTARESLRPEYCGEHFLSPELRRFCNRCNS